MSRAPGILLKPSRALPSGDQTGCSSTLGWRIVNPDMPNQWTISVGASTEKLAGIHGTGREAQDEFTARSRRLTAAARGNGFIDPWVIPVAGAELGEEGTCGATRRWR